MRTECSIEIERPIEEVFDYTINHVTEWSTTVVEEEVLEETPNHIGTKFRSVTQSHGRPMEFLGEVTDHVPPHASAVTLRGAAFDLDVAYLFEDLDGRTRVTQIADVHGKGVFRIMLAIFGRFGQSASQQAQLEELKNLKFLLETNVKPSA
ncbi:MAG: hypothetical protein KDA75_04950 [Planctomycetaceae bacterium]|nr:hypothetical protein [Planctomycetaceae bacterium]